MLPKRWYCPFKYRYTFQKKHNIYRTKNILSNLPSCFAGPSNCQPVYIYKWIVYLCCSCQFKNVIIFVNIAYLVSWVKSLHHAEIGLCTTGVDILLQNPELQAALQLQRGKSITSVNNAMSCKIAESCVVFCMDNTMLSDIVAYDTLTVRPLVHNFNLIRNHFYCFFASGVLCVPQSCGRSCFRSKCLFVGCEFKQDW